MPRTPVMPIFSGFIELLGLNLFQEAGLSDLIVPYDISNRLHQKVETRAIFRLTTPIAIAPIRYRGRY
jgi:hypothetical protein